MLRPKRQPPISQMIVENKEDQAEIVKDIDLDTKEFQNALNKHIEIMKKDVRNKSHSLSPCEEKTISYSEFKEFSQKSVPLRKGDTGLGRPHKSPIGPPVDMPKKQEGAIVTIPAASNQQDVKNVDKVEVNKPANKITINDRPTVVPNTTIRGGDTGLGRPHKSPIGPPIDMPQEEPIATIPATSNQQDVKFYENFEHNACHKFIMKINRILIGVLIFVAAILGCFIVTEFAAFCADIQNMSLWGKIPLILFMGICSIIILAVIIKIVSFMFKLRSSPQINIKALEQRSALQRIENATEVKKELLTLLRNEYRDIDIILKNVGCDKEKINTVVNKRNRLLNENLTTISSSEWIDNFKSFLAELDKIADARIKNYAMKVSVLGTISPFSVFDRFIVLAACLSLVKDLMLIYAMKPNWHKSIILISWMIINSYFAGMVQIGTQVIEDLTTKGVALLGPLFGVDPDHASSIAPVAGKITGKVSEAVVFYMLILKLGQYVKKQLRPIRK